MKAGCLAAVGVLALLAAVAWYFATRPGGPVDLYQPPPSVERLLQAARRGDIAGMDGALAQGAPIDDGDPLYQETAMIRAALFGQRAAVAHLLKAGARTTKVAAGFLTPLHAAAQGGDAGIVADLLAAGADVHAGRDHKFTPLQAALDAMQPAVVGPLVAAGARHEDLQSNLADFVSLTLGRGTPVRLEVIRAFTSARSGLDLPGVEGEPALVLVAERCDDVIAADVTSWFVGAGARRDTPGKSGRTPASALRARLAKVADRPEAAERCEAVSSALSAGGAR